MPQTTPHDGEPRRRDTRGIATRLLADAAPEHRAAIEALVAARVSVATGPSDLSVPGQRRTETALLIGPPGAGKEYVIRKVSEAFDDPLVEIPATNLVRQGIVGFSPQEVGKTCQDHLQAGVPKGRGVLWVHGKELDKCARRPAGSSYDMALEAQQALLALLDGGFLDRVPGTVIFVFDGAFVGVEAIVAERIQTPPRGAPASSLEQAIGLENENPTPAELQGALYACVTAADLETFGLIRELVVRMRRIAVVAPLGAESLGATAPGVVADLAQVFQRHGVDLVVTRGAMRELTRRAAQGHGTVRELRFALARILTPTLAILPDLAASTRVVAIGARDLRLCVAPRLFLRSQPWEAGPAQPLIRSGHKRDDSARGPQRLRAGGATPGLPAPSAGDPSAPALEQEIREANRDATDECEMLLFSLHLLEVPLPVAAGLARETGSTRGDVLMSHLLQTLTRQRGFPMESPAPLSVLRFVRIPKAWGTGQGRGTAS